MPTTYAELAQLPQAGEYDDVSGYRQPSDERILAGQAGRAAFEDRINEAKQSLPMFEPIDADPANGPMFEPIGDGPTGLSQSDANYFMFTTAAKDTVRGIPQWLGYNNEKDAADQKMMNRIMEDPELGTEATAWMMAGYAADTVGWLLPVSKLKYVKGAPDFFKKMMGWGAVGGAISGATGYVDPDGKSLVGMAQGEDKPMTRLEQTGLGAGIGTVAGPLIGGAAKLVKKGYEPIGAMAHKVLTKTPEGAVGSVGAVIGYNVDQDASQEDKWRNALLGATTGMVAGHMPKFADQTGMTKGLKAKTGMGANETAGHWLDSDYDKADDWIFAMNRFMGNKSIYANDWDSLTQGVMDLTAPERKVLYRMLTDRNMGLANNDFELDKLGITSEAREKIQEYGQAMVNLGVLEDKVFLKNIDDYLTTSYLKHDQMNFYDPTDNLNNANHMFHMRGRVEKVNKNQWEAGARPDEGKGEWEFIDDLGDGKVRVRRQWTKEEKAEWGEIEDAGYALHKTGRMMGHERALGEFFNDISQSPDIAKAADVLGTVKVPQGRIWGNMAGKNVDPKVWEEMKKLREFSKPGSGAAAWNAYKVANGVWKGGKTILSIPVHVGNVVSSGSMFDLAGGRWLDVPKAAMNMYKQDETFMKMMEDGVFGSGILKELEEGRAILKVYANESAGYWPRLGNGPGGLQTAIQWTGKVLKQLKTIGWDNPAKLYQLEDSIWRAGLYRTKLDDALRNGVDERTARGMATRAAKEFFVDYSKNPPVLKALRHSFIPFLSYTYGTIPRLAEVATKNPMKLAKWAAMGYGLNEMNMRMADENQNRLDKISDRVEPNGMFGMQWMPNARTFLPDWISERIAPGSRDVQSLNYERMLAGGKFSMQEGGVGQLQGVPSPVQISGGVAGAVVAPMMGMNPSLGTEVPEGEKLDTVIRNLLPNWEGLQIGDLKTWATEKVDKADSGKTTPNKDDYTPITARLSNAGIRVEPLHENKLGRRIRGKYMAKIKVKQKQLRSIKNNVGIEDSSKKRQMNAIKAEIRKLKQAMNLRLRGG